MKIEIKGNQGKKYYDEFLYMFANYKKIKSSPRVKIGSASKSAILSELVAIIGLILLTVYYFNSGKEMLNLLAIIFFAFFALLATIYLILVFVKIRKLKKSNEELVFEINKKNIKVSNNDYSYKLNIDELETIMINENTMFFIPKDDDMSFLAISSKYKEKIIKFAKENGIDKLIVDNTVNESED